MQIPTGVCLVLLQSAFLLEIDLEKGGIVSKVVSEYGLFAKYCAR